MIFLVKFYYVPHKDSLLHHGTKGQKWGHRRYQNQNGTWTEEGKARRRVGSSKKTKLKSTEQLRKDYPSFTKSMFPKWDLDENDPKFRDKYDTWTRLDGDIRDALMDIPEGTNFSSRDEFNKTILNKMGYENTYGARQYIHPLTDKMMKPYLKSTEQLMKDYPIHDDKKQDALYRQITEVPFREHEVKTEESLYPDWDDRKERKD